MELRPNDVPRYRDATQRIPQAEARNFGTGSLVTSTDLLLTSLNAFRTLG